MKNRSIFKRIFCIVLCLCMMGTLALGLVSCDDEDIEDPSQGGSDEVYEKVAVVRPVKNIAKGKKIEAEDVEIFYMPEDQISFNALRSVDDVVGKYATMKLYKDDFIMASKVSDTLEENVEYTASTTYIIATDHDIDATGKTNVAAKIQALVSKYPGKTIYFPDGIYMINSTITTSATAAKSVSFVFSGNAKLKAGTSFPAGSPMLSIGGKDSGTDTTSVTVTGGIFDCNSKANGISLDGGRNIFVSDVSIINASVGLLVTKDVHADVESLTIAGTYADKSVGVKVNGSENTFTNIRVYGCGTGVEATKSGNMFRNVICKYFGNSADSKGFYDNSDRGNDYDGCMSNDFAKGFVIGGNAECNFSLCSVLWEDANTAGQIGFYNEGKFNSVIRSCKVMGTNGKNAKFNQIAQSGGRGVDLYNIYVNCN